MPYRGRIVPELADIGVLSYREIVVKPWRLIYRVDIEQATVFVVAVLDSRRDLETLLLERLTR